MAGVVLFSNGDGGGRGGAAVRFREVAGPENFVLVELVAGEGSGSAASGGRFRRREDVEEPVRGRRSAVAEAYSSIWLHLVKRTTILENEKGKDAQTDSANAGFCRKFCL